MFTVILADKNATELHRASHPENDQVLVVGEGRGFALLANLDRYDVDVFAPDQMQALIEELRRRQGSIDLPDLRAHVDRLIEMATLCAHLPGATLTFSPYASPDHLGGSTEH